MSIVNNPNNEQVLQFLQGHISEHGEQEIKKDQLTPLGNEGKKQFTDAVAKGMEEIKEADQRDKTAVENFAQVMGDESRDQFVSIMKGGLSAMASTLSDDNPEKAKLLKLRDDVETIGKSGLGRASLMPGIHSLSLPPKKLQKDEPTLKTYNKG